MASLPCQEGHDPQGHTAEHQDAEKNQEQAQGFLDPGQPSVVPAQVGSDFLPGQSRQKKGTQNPRA